MKYINNMINKISNDLNLYIFDFVEIQDLFILNQHRLLSDKLLQLYINKYNLCFMCLYELNFIYNKKFTIKGNDCFSLETFNKYKYDVDNFKLHYINKNKFNHKYTYNHKLSDYNHLLFDILKICHFPTKNIFYTFEYYKMIFRYYTKDEKKNVCKNNNCKFCIKCLCISKELNLDNIYHEDGMYQTINIKKYYSFYMNYLINNDFYKELKYFIIMTNDFVYTVSFYLKQHLKLTDIFDEYNILYKNIILYNNDYIKIIKSYNI